MSRPLKRYCAQTSSIFSRSCVTLLAATLVLAMAGCGNGSAPQDTGTTTDQDGTGDTDVHINHDADIKHTDVEGTDIAIDATDLELPDGSDAVDATGTDGDSLTDTAIDTDETAAGDADALSDTTDDADTTDVPDIQPDSASDDVEVSACEFPQNPMSGQEGWQCASNDECDFGYCVDTPDQKVCTRSCTNTCCPGGWGCKNVAQAGDPVYGCVPNLVHPCDPCTDNSQCQSPGDPNGLCLSYGDVGSFCGGTCASGSNAECPVGYYCLKNAKGTANGVSGVGTSNQCMKKSGTCDCSNTAKKQGMSTICLSKNKYGTCTGNRSCQQSGLTGCDAKSPTAEVCNGLDDNCDGQTDEPGASMCTVYWKDADQDGFGNSPATGGDNQCLCKPVGLYTSTSPSDCDDANAQVKPTAIEVCDGIDNDCNGKTDETCDMDKDGYCAADAVILPGTKACKYKGVDCDDTNPKIHPGQPEICGNGIDDDCDGYTDSGATDAVGCTLFYEDGDKDGVGTFNSECLCAPSGIFTATVSGDCNDSNKNVYPGAKEICGNGIDDNCNGKQDEAGAVGCTMFYKDLDSDGYGDSSSKPACLCAPSAIYTTAKGGDCNDSDPKINPGMTEVCNNLDDDCDGITDNNNALGCTTFYADYDKDGFGDSKKALCLCAATDKWTATIGGDCDDSKANVNPVAPEICDGLDNDCNGIIDDPGAQGCVMAFKDADGDGFGDPTTKACVCGLSMPYNTFKGDDCDDKLASVYPGAPEKCNGIDDNCDGTTDEANAQGCTIYFADTDNDGVGNSAKAACLCAKNWPYVTTKGGDCNDADPTIKPGNIEVCDGKDNDCDGIIDNQNAIGCNVYYLDVDNDGYGDITNVTRCLCTSDGSYKVLQGGDCDDKNAAIHPGVAEKCNGLDDDCDGIVDPVGSIGCTNYYPDKDNDGYGDMYATTWACQCGPLYPNTSTAAYAKDCNDNNPLISPGAFEICGDGIDNNCNGLTDEPTTNTLFYIDVDGDGYGSGAGQSLCKPGMVNGQMFSASQAGDCNDALAAVHPNAAEICNGIDDNCNGFTDEQLPSVMCGSVANGDPACIAGKCTPQCYATWFDANGIASDGCECKADSFYGSGVGDTCGAPVDLGYIYDDGSPAIVKTGNIMPGENGDWYHFKAIDASDATGSCDPFNVHVWLTGNPDGNFTVDLYKHGCGNTYELCGNEVDTGWTVSFKNKSPYGPQAAKGTNAGITEPSPIPEIGGECNCVNVVSTPGQPGAGLPNMNYCTDNSDDFYVRVGRQPGAGTICQNYTLSVSNGVPY